MFCFILCCSACRGLRSLSYSVALLVSFSAVLLVSFSGALLVSFSAVLLASFSVALLVSFSFALLVSISAVLSVSFSAALSASVSVALSTSCFAAVSAPIFHAISASFSTPAYRLHFWRAVDFLAALSSVPLCFPARGVEYSYLLRCQRYFRRINRQVTSLDFTNFSIAVVADNSARDQLNERGTQPRYTQGCSYINAKWHIDNEGHMFSQYVKQFWTHAKLSFTIQVFM